MTESSLPMRVRTAAAEVAARADSVHIRHDKLAAYAALLLKQGVNSNMTDLDTRTLGAGETAEEKAAYVVALDAVNFGSGYFKSAQDKGAALEYADIALDLRRAFDDKRLDRPEKWVDVTAADCHGIFNIPEGLSEETDALMRLYAAHLREAGEYLLRDYGGTALGLVAAARSAARLAELVGAWPGFGDIADYDGLPVPIFKRAQILAADMHLALGGTGAADFTDLDSLTIFADNMVPHVLRHDGILDYAPPLAAAIDAGEILKAGSAFEVELRAVSIHAVECLKVAAQAQGHNVSSLDLDRILWNRGYTQAFFGKPPHRTLTVWY